jgi:hypothetical protein
MPAKASDPDPTRRDDILIALIGAAAAAGADSWVYGFALGLGTDECFTPVSQCPAVRQTRHHLLASGLATTVFFLTMLVLPNHQKWRPHRKALRVLTILAAAGP